MRPKFPVVCFVILSVTLLLGGLATLGGFVLLYFYYPDASTQQVAEFLAVNGLVCWALAILCALAAWRLFKQVPGAGKFAGVTWALATGFTLWVVLFFCLQSWNTGGIVEVGTWGALETLIGAWLLRSKGRVGVAQGAAR